MFMGLESLYRTPFSCEIWRHFVDETTPKLYLESFVITDVKVSTSTTPFRTAADL